MCAEELPILPYLYPQPTMRVSPIFKVYPIWNKRNGSVVHAEATLQLFYAADGTISFIVLGVEKFSISQQQHTTTTEFNVSTVT